MTSKELADKMQLHHDDVVAFYNYCDTYMVYNHFTLYVADYKYNGNDLEYLYNIKNTFVYAICCYYRMLHKYNDIIKP